MTRDEARAAYFQKWDGQHEPLIKLLATGDPDAARTVSEVVAKMPRAEAMLLVSNAFHNFDAGVARRAMRNFGMPPLAAIEKEVSDVLESLHAAVANNDRTVIPRIGDFLMKLPPKGCVMFASFIYDRFDLAWAAFLAGSLQGEMLEREIDEVLEAA